MKYYVFETETVNEQQAFLVTPKGTYEEACGLFHQILASAYSNSNLTYALVMIITRQGSIMKSETINKQEETTEE